MEVIGGEMVGMFPNLMSEGVLPRREAIKRVLKPEDWSFDKAKGCFIVNGGEVFVHTISQKEIGNRPNACQHCMYRFQVRLAEADESKKILAAVCPAVNLCSACSRRFGVEAEGNAVFFQSSLHFKTGEDDKVEMVVRAAPEESPK